MLLPTQQSQGLAAINLMQSMLERIEERRKRDEEKRTGREKDPITEARIGASEEARRMQGKIASALFGSGTSNVNEMKIALTERLASKLGIDLEDARSSYRLGRALEDALKDMAPDKVAELADHIGLSDLGVSMQTLLNAIKNPYADDNQRLTDALTKKANGGKIDTEIGRIVQRLEDVSDPKTLEELRLGPQGYDPTRVDDAQTRAERQADIAAAEAGKKLDDVQKIQDAIREDNDDAVKGPAGGEATAAPDEATLLTVLAAAAEQVSGTGESETTDEALAGATGDTGAATGMIEDEAKTSEVAAEAALEAGHEKVAGILPVNIDDIGIYELLKLKRAA